MNRQINSMSDLHLEFGGNLELPGGDILLLPGDVCIADYLRPERTDKHARIHRDRYKLFFDKECSKYNSVYYIMGNHEHYHGVLDDNYYHLKDFLKDTNVNVLDNEFVDIDQDWVLFGGTMWTDYFKNDWFATNSAKTNMSDHNVIKKIKSGRPRQFLPEDAIIEHERCLKILKNGLVKYNNKKIIIMTHHAPHANSISDCYKGNILNGAYYSHQEDLILDNPAIKHWLHGHVHDSFNYNVGQCQVLCNPRGYYGEHLNLGFSLDAGFKINIGKTIKPV